MKLQAAQESFEEMPDERRHAATGLHAEASVATLPAPSAEASTSKSSGAERAYQEYCQRRDQGEAIDPDQFCAKFPSVKSALGKLVQWHLFLEDHPDLVAEEEASICWPEPGESFLDCQLLLELGKGSFARVFLAMESKLGDRLVAVKIAPKGGPAEAELLGRLKHPNIVPVYSIQEDEATGLTGVCMPYAGSATLENVFDHVYSQTKPRSQARLILDAVGVLPYPMDEGAHPPAADPILKKGTYVDGIRFVGAQLADALAFIHQQGICHRDLKLSNVLMSPEGIPMLLDFNLSADVKDLKSKLGGTLTYMSPEQLLATDPDGPADAASMDGRSDIFSLGVMLYQLLTGKYPFGSVPLKTTAREFRQLLLERQRVAPASVGQVNPDIDPAFSRLIQRCLAHDPKDRPQSAADVANALRKDLTPLRRTWRWIGRHPRMMAASLVMFLALGVAGVSAAALRTPSHRESPMQAGLECYQQHQFADALAYFDVVLKADRDNGSALIARARTYQQIGATDPHGYQAAIKDYEGAAKFMAPGQADGCIGYCYLRAKLSFEHAKLYCQKAIDDGFATAEVYNNLGYCQQGLTKFDDARQALDQAIEMDPRLQAAYHNRALVYLDKAADHRNLLRQTAKGVLIAGFETHNQKVRQDIELCVNAGIKDIEKAIEIGPATADLHYDAACLHGAAIRNGHGSKDAAFEHYSQALKRGFDPQRFRKEKILVSLNQEERFTKLLNAAASSKTWSRSVRIVDPITDLSR